MVKTLQLAMRGVLRHSPTCSMCLFSAWQATRFLQEGREEEMAKRRRPRRVRLLGPLWGYWGLLGDLLLSLRGLLSNDALIEALLLPFQGSKPQDFLELAIYCPLSHRYENNKKSCCSGTRLAFLEVLRTCIDAKVKPQKT